MIKQCVICGNNFVPDKNHPHQKYCGEECRKERNRRRAARYRQKHPEYKNKYYKTHREEILFKQKQYRWNKERL